MSQELSNIDYAKLAKVTAAEEKVAAVHLWKHKTQGKIADSKNKRLIILMGPPGSGKSSLAAKYQQQNPNLITIGRDDVYAYHPRMFELAAKRPVQLNSKELDCYDNPIFSSPQQDPLQEDKGEKYIEEFAEDVYLKTVSKLFEKGHSILLDGLVSEEMLTFATLGKSIGYQVDFMVTSAPKRVLDQNIISRYEQGAERFEAAQKGALAPTAENVMHPYAKMRLAAEDIAYSAEIISDIAKQGFSICTTNPLNNQVLGKGKMAAQAYKDEISRPLNNKERANLEGRQQTTLQKMQRRGASRYEMHVASQAAR